MLRNKTGSRAWSFDRKSISLEENWLYLEFGESYMDARVIGNAKGKSEDRLLLKLDIDEETVSWEMEYQVVL